MSRRRSLSIIVVPDGGRESRTFQITYRRLRILGVVAFVASILLALMASSWWYLAVRSARVDALEAEVASLHTDQARLAAFAAELRELERRYARIRGMFGSGGTSATSDLWLPPPGSGRAGPGADDPESALPTSWPLTERGFVTQPLVPREEGEHPGLDVAVPMHSYIRASGAGTVLEAGEDEIYGRYVVVDHGNGYLSRYAHASELVVVEGQEVRRNEVIGLSGSTGRSTAPHLHFEIFLDGEAIDPLTLVRQPS